MTWKNFKIKGKTEVICTLQLVLINLEFRELIGQLMAKESSALQLSLL